MRTQRNVYSNLNNCDDNGQLHDWGKEQEMDIVVSDAMVEPPQLIIKPKGEQLGENIDKEPEKKSVGNRISRKEKKLNLAKEKEEKNKKLELAARDWMNGKFKSVRECARVHHVPHRTLHKGIVTNAGLFKGSGKFSTILSREEEMLVKEHVLYMEKIGYGLSLTSLRVLVHDLLMGALRAKPNRITGLKICN